MLRGAEVAAPVVLALTEYHGGDGSQMAAVVEGGAVTAGPFVGENAINRALRLLGSMPAGLMTSLMRSVFTGGGGRTTLPAGACHSEAG